MRTPSKVLSLLVAGLFLVPQFALADKGQDDYEEYLPKNLEFRTPNIPVPTNVEVKTDNRGTRTFRVNANATASPSASPAAKVEGRQFCARISDTTKGVSDDVAERFNELSAKFQERGDKIRSDFKTIVDTQGANRATADKSLNEKLAALQAKATTDAQKQAVADFAAAVKAAVAARRAAVDAANNTFKQGLLEANTTRQAALKTAATSYRAAVATAVANAKASCTAGTDPQTVRNTLKAALATAKTALETARDNAGKTSTNVDALKAARKAAVDKANADFKAAIRAALAKLNAALGVTASPSPTSTSTAQ